MFQEEEKPKEEKKVRKARIARERAERDAKCDAFPSAVTRGRACLFTLRLRLIEEKLASWDPTKDPNIEGDAYLPIPRFPSQRARLNTALPPLTVRYPRIEINVALVAHKTGRSAQ